MKRLLIVGSGCIVLVAAILFGAFFFGPLSALAHNTFNQTDTNKTDTYCQQFQQDLAKRLNVSTDQLNKDRQESISDVLDQMVKDGKITQDQADKAKQNLSKRQWCGWNGQRVENANALQYLRDHRTDLVNALTKDLKLSSDDLTKQLKDGKKLVDIAKAQGVSAKDLEQAIKKDVDTVLNQGVSEGKLTKDEVTQFDNALKKRADVIHKLINRVK
ncbi:hypothetical protein [Ktedonospora formicarum]|uniref:Uncharacterized protein n=1 Tax=Ktedonospora formicarum TaxID=2778364 RepID=A0A8J3I0S0_9CHLR|nr:hypothetical protein [Ktedonospora formicarum]GHO44685.1 hypothetical protein KSX_28480 [Ktedonospora formicarum]